MLISYDEMSTLKLADELRSVADTALIDNQLQSLAHMLNTAANTGAYSILWAGELFDENIQTLKEHGYSIEPVDNVARDNNPQYRINFNV